MKNRKFTKSWVQRMFDAKAVGRGGIIRRKIASVLKHGSEAELLTEVKTRGFHLVKTGDQYVVLCHRGDITLAC